MRFATVLLLGLWLAGCSRRASPPAASPRLVSLSPAVTETLFALGAGGEVVGVSDFCDWPPEVRSLPRVGTTLTPAYEAMARLHPTLILADVVKQSPREALAALAPVEELPWLTLAEVVKSTRQLGQLSSHQAQADALADRVKATLSRRAAKDAPRVLLALGDTPGPLTSVWYIKRTSLHGAALEAAGARNAVDFDDPGAPNLSLEKVIALDPDAVIILVAVETLSPEEQERYLSGWRALSVMRAVKEGKVRLLHGAGVQSEGPRILSLVERLQEELRDLARAPGSRAGGQGTP